MLAVAISDGSTARANASIQDAGNANPSARDDPSPESQSQNSIDNIFKQVFGKERPALGQGNYVVLIEGVNVGEYLVTPANGGQPGSVDASFVKTVLAPITVEETANLLKARADGKDSVTFDVLRELGLMVEFDDAQLVCVLTFQARSEQSEA